MDAGNGLIDGRPDLSNRDQHFMQLALDLAASGQGHVEPNPMVGCVLVKDNEIIGQGFHQRFGGAHAEVNALHSLGSGVSSNGSTAYVTLEPCCHHGKTPPCAQALIDAGVQRVVAAMRDPFSEVDGGGIAQLRAAGLTVDVGILEDQAVQLNAPYLKRIQHAKPWVIAKWAMTIDGRIATATGESQWITSESARREAHRLRGRVDAVAVGMGTVQADNPMLTARGIDPLPRQACRIVYASKRLPATDSKLVTSARDWPTLLVIPKAVSASSRVQRLVDAGVQLLCTDQSAPARVVDESLCLLAKRGMTNLMVEGGGELLASFLAVNQIDEIHVSMGAKLFGGQSALGPIGGAGIREVAQATQWRIVSTDQLDHDLRVVYRQQQTT